MACEAHEKRILELELQLAETKQQLEFYKSMVHNPPKMHLNQFILNLPPSWHQMDNSGPGRR